MTSFRSMDKKNLIYTFKYLNDGIESWKNGVFRLLITWKGDFSAEVKDELRVFKLGFCNRRKKIQFTHFQSAG